MGIRGRIALAISFVTALAVVVLGVTVHHISGLERDKQAREYQDGLLSSALQVYQRDGTLVLGAQLDDSRVPARLAQAVARGKPKTYISGGGDPRVWAATGVGDGKVLSVSASYPARDPLQRSLDQTLIVAGAVTVALMAVVALFVAQSLSRRLRLSAAAARRIAAGESQDADALLTGGRDEVAELGRSVHHMATSLAARVEAERGFTADVAHELRTPVAGLVASAELLPHPRAVEMVRERAQTMRALVEDLLEVSRLDAGAESAQLDAVELPSLVRGIVKRAQGQRGVADVAVEVIGEGRIVATDARRVERILVNILANAAKHGRPPIEVTVQGTRIAVRDHGDGFPPGLVDRGPRRFRTAAPERGTGHGLGLTIAVGQAAVLGARLTFGAAEGGGALAVLDLPEAEDVPEEDRPVLRGADSGAGAAAPTAPGP
ncbi:MULTISPECIES: sensor histidine kinase [Streptomyces]|uniref:histidine kinase n=1 Tax=Streptomyces morookaense TaxID=1970 RepID=A0A7Y7B9B2_STRMO|nr:MULTISPECIES: HAMP domain-containing sensor histidine kinase [Streptomyces]MCC2275725.1 HAMP domain-containing histidine kinase [Streptomyces sp. ET3-23]NVK81403.1 HAMP domain-containing histidine kinase [Streptomyces morookaense]